MKISKRNLVKLIKEQYEKYNEKPNVWQKLPGKITVKDKIIDGMYLKTALSRDLYGECC